MIRHAMPHFCGVACFQRLAMTVLILGFGNLDRQDDGVAWYILSELMQRHGLQKPTTIDIDEYSPEKDIHFLFQLQLVPELADDLYQYDQAVFIDAHTGSVLSEINMAEISPEYQHSPLTHHLTAPSLLSITSQIYHKFPKSILISVRGYQFNFSQELSSFTMALIPLTVTKIEEWIVNLKS